MTFKVPTSKKKVYATEKLGSSFVAAYSFVKLTYYVYDRDRPMQGSLRCSLDPYKGTLFWVLTSNRGSVNAAILLYNTLQYFFDTKVNIVLRDWTINSVLKR